MEGGVMLRGRTLSQVVGGSVAVVALSLCVLTVTIVGLRGGDGGRVELMGDGYINSPHVMGAPAWVAAGKAPMDYFADQSALQNTRDLNFWPGAGSVIPEINRPSEPLETPDWIGNGRGIYGSTQEDGTFVPVAHKFGFMARGCTRDGECQNADVCEQSKCVPTIALGVDGDDAHARAWRQASTGSSAPTLREPGDIGYPVAAEEEVEEEAEEEAAEEAAAEEEEEAAAKEEALFAWGWNAHGQLGLGDRRQGLVVYFFHFKLLPLIPETT